MSWIFVSMVLAFAAGVTNLSTLGIPLSKHPMARSYWMMHALVGVGGLAYSVSYAVLLYDSNVSRTAWSEFMAPFSSVTFFVVWFLPAVLYRQAAKLDPTRKHRRMS